MYTYNLMNVPNQDFSVVANGNEFLIRLRTYRGIVYADISINGEVVNVSMRCLPNRRIFTDAITHAAGGVFMFKCLGDRLPNYEDFNTENCMFVLIEGEE